MKRVLVFGMSPLPTENDTCTLAPGKRTWQFVRPILKQGHRVCLICCRHLAAYKKTDLPPIQAEEHGNLVYYSLAQEVFEDPNWLQRTHDHFEPDCIVCATVFPSFVATHLRTDRPIWADLFGHVMAEAQTKSFVFKDNYYISKLWEQEKRILDYADIFSVVSGPQSYATMGELGTRFRLNSNTTGYSFTKVIPCAINEGKISSDLSDKKIRGVEIPEDAFMILWSGGFNTWTDIKTLIKSLDTLFEKYDNCYFVSTGGEIASHDELTYKNFVEKVAASRFKDHYLLKGWIPYNEIPCYVNEADIGINIDLFSYEGILGSRNRLLDWMHMKLPVVTSELCELSMQIKDKKLGLTFYPEDADGLTQTLETAINNKDLLQDYADNAYRFVMTELTAEATTKPLLDWIDKPSKAPDWENDAKPDEQNSNSWKVIKNHYQASIKNNIQTRGFISTMKWLVTRSPVIRKLIN